MILRSKITAISFIFIATMLLLIVSCKNPSNPVSDSGLQIDASDPLDVLRALPTELNRPDSMIARFASSGSRAATVPTANSEVFHPDAVICPPLAKEKVETASLAISIVQILKKMSDNPFNATIVVDSGLPVSLGPLTMEADVMKPLFASSLIVDYRGLLIDTLPASEESNGVSGFAYYLPFTFQHEGDPYVLHNYFEFFYENEENMVLTAITYVFDGDDYQKYHTTIMTIDEGNQIIERYENGAPELDFTDNDYTYEKFSYNIQTDTTQAFIVSRGSSEGIYVVTANRYGGMAMSTRYDEFTEENLGTRELFAEDYNIMARFIDSDIDNLLPIDFPTTIDSTFCEYSYRYLDGADTESLVVLANIIDHDGSPGTQAEVYPFISSAGGVNDPGDPFRLGSINSSIIDYVTEQASSYYSEIRSTLDADLNSALHEAPGWIRMDTESLGVDDPAALATVFDTIQAL